MDPMKQYRQEIDSLDDQIMELLERRYQVVDLVGQHKRASNGSIIDPKRESIILAKASKYSHSPQIQQVYRTILLESHQLQRK
jgi:chorismate mutase